MAEPDKKTRIPPNSKESEMMVLGCMLTSVNALNIAADSLTDSHFYYTEHQTIYSVLKAAYCADKPADIHLIAEELKRQNKLDNVGGVSYLTTLAQYAGTSAFIEEYVSLLREKSVLRQMINAAQRVEKTALEEPSDVYAALDEAQTQFFGISQENQNQAGVLIKDLISGVKAETKIPYLKELQERQQNFKEKGPNDSLITGVPTHFIDLDKMLNGFNPSNLMLLAARPAMGKTALAVNIAEHICFRNHTPVGIFSLEMSASQLLHRMICSQAEVESEKIQTGSLNGAEYQRIVACANMMQKNVMIIDDQPGLKITDLRARARRMKETHNIGFIMIDYLQLLSGSGNNRAQENRQNEISEISRMLKNLARELNIPILCLAQLSRKVEERQGHRPMMSDLRESGCLTGDTFIKDAETGLLYTIKELAERKEQKPIQVFAVDENLKMGSHTLTKAFYSGRKIVYELTTRSGRKIKATANHPFLCIDGWTRLDQLKKGSHIALPRTLNTKPIHSPLAKEELVLIGHLLGDGCILPNQPYHYTSADKENIHLVQDALQKLFSINSKGVQQTNWFHVYFPSPVRLARGKYHPITSWFQKLEIDRVKSYEKKVPPSIFSRPEKDRLLFLRNLWATDGNISSKRLQGRRPAGNIYYASSSRTLAAQVQHLLLSTGIQSTLKVHDYKPGYRSMYHVHVQGTPNQQLFLTKVGCSGERGKIIPTLLEDLKQIKPNPNNDIIPKAAWQIFVKKAKDSKQLGWRDVCKGLNTSYCGTTLLKAGISRQRMGRLAQFLEDPELKRLAESEVCWDEISSITEIGEEDVYDATVPSVHNFVANDIIVHNSLEQDSDVVMFLLRREYYDPYDKPGLAELIVAKNRHGGVGSVDLAFRKEIAQFANYTPMQGQGQAQIAKSNKQAFSAFSPEE
jgi:replicative DNA helicase